MKKNSKIRKGYLMMMCLLIIMVACTTKPQQPPVEYTCPMHPKVVEQKPGKCPICGMNLVKKRTSVKDNSLLNSPTDKNYRLVTNTFKTIQPRTSTNHSILKINGVITPDEKQSESIAARYGGRIEKLYLKTIYQSVEKGDKLFDLYSPELLSAQREFLYILKSDKDNALLVSQAQDKLTLWGLSQKQIQALISSDKPSSLITIYSNVRGYLGKTESNIKEGDYLQPGQEIFKILSLQSIWADFDVVNLEAAEIKIHDPIVIQLNVGEEILGTIDFIQPFQQGEETFAKVRAYLPQQRNKLRPGQVVSGLIKQKSSGMMRVPATTVIDLGDRKVVFVRKNGKIHPIKIETGSNNGSEVTVNSGLQATDSVVLNAGFIMDSDAFIKTEN